MTKHITCVDGATEVLLLRSDISKMWGVLDTMGFVSGLGDVGENEDVGGTSDIDDIGTSGTLMMLRINCLCCLNVHLVLILCLCKYCLRFIELNDHRWLKRHIDRDHCQN